MKIRERIIADNVPPTLTTDLWLDTSGEKPVLKAYCNNVWKGVAAQSSGIDFENTPMADLVTAAITKGQYLRYEDVPAVKEGENPGFCRPDSTSTIYPSSWEAYYRLVDDIGNTIVGLYEDAFGENGK